MVAIISSRSYPSSPSKEIRGKNIFFAGYLLISDHIWSFFVDVLLFVVMFSRNRFKEQSRQKMVAFCGDLHVYILLFLSYIFFYNPLQWFVVWLLFDLIMQIYAMPVFDMLETMLVKRLHFPPGLMLRLIARSVYVGNGPFLYAAHTYSIFFFCEHFFFLWWMFTDFLLWYIMCSIDNVHCYYLPLL